VLGYRAWVADERDQLWPIYSARRPWLPGINTARCNCKNPHRQTLRFEWSWHNGRRVLEPAPEHPAPDAGCVCGLYSWRRPSKRWPIEPRWETSREVVGAVASWGHLQVHADGFRAEHACVVTLAYHPDTTSDALPALRRIAARYRVELVPLTELEEAASVHGTPLPDTLCPPTETPHPAPPPPTEPEFVPESGPSPAPDATIEQVGSAPRKIGFDGRPLPKNPYDARY
jgi:hypothetical protein